MTDQLYINESNEEFDVLIVGSGITGGWAAKEFCERGFKTLMVERGRVVKHRIDYTGEGKRPWEQPFRQRVAKELVDSQYTIQKQCYAFNDATKHFFGNDKDLPYSTEKSTKFSWIRANQLGGKSLLWHRQSYRLSDFDFNANRLDGHGNDWPIRYDDLKDFYTHVEKFAGINGTHENLPQLPDSDYQPPFELARNECQKGCSFGAYFSTQSSTLPAAAKTNKLHIAPNSVVHSLIYDEKSNRVKGVRVIDNDDLSEREYYAKVVFLCASTVGSTQVLLNSSTKTFPNGLANSSGTLGHYLMDHNYNADINGTIEGFEKEYYKGRRPTGIYIPNFHFEPDRYHSKFVRGYAFAGSAYRENWGSRAAEDGIGVDFKNRLKQPGKWKIRISAQGEMLPKFENQMSLHPSKKDKWGIPQVLFDIQWSDNERAMMRSAAKLGEKMLSSFGATEIWSNVKDDAPGLAIHEVGTARMGRDPKESVLNGYNQSHDIPNLFVTDGASFCSTAVQNPSLTFMALTVRAVDYAAKEVKAGRI